MDITLARRQLLRRAGFVAGGAVLATTAMAAPAHAGEAPDDDLGLAGAWLLDRTDDDGYHARGVFTFAVGGVVHYQDISPVAPMLHGAWTSGPKRTFRYETWAGIPADEVGGIPALTVRVVGTGTWTRDTFTNPYVLTAFLADGGIEVARSPGKAFGTRIRP